MGKLVKFLTILRWKRFLLCFPDYRLKHLQYAWGSCLDRKESIELKKLVKLTILVIIFPKVGFFDKLSLSKCPKFCIIVVSSKRGIKQAHKNMLEALGETKS